VNAVWLLVLGVVFYENEGGWVLQNTTETNKRKTSIDSHINVSKHKQIFLHAKLKFYTRSLLRIPAHPKLTVYMFSL
jgi:hypothetical protein